MLSLSFHVPLSSKVCQFALDAKYAAECSSLLLALGCVAWKLSEFHPDSPNVWLSIELLLVILASLIYVFCTHFSISTSPAPTKTQSVTSPVLLRSASPRFNEAREFKRASSHLPVPPKPVFGYVWMTVPKNYRNSTDDGMLSGLILGPLIASSLLYASQKMQASATSPDTLRLPSHWYIEPPPALSNLGKPLSLLQALVLSRRNAVSLATLCSTILLVHVCASWGFEALYRRRTNVAEGERASVPRSEARKSWLYVLFTSAVCLGLLALRFLFERAHLGVWQAMSYWEIACASVFYQLSLYIAIRLAHRGFTLGELSLVVFGATGLYMELVNLTIARIWPVTTPFIKTYRLPTPLLIYQIALIPGSLLTGFLLSPLLVLSRQIAQRPVRRLRFPHEKQAHRRALAAGFYLGATLIIGGLIGMWTRWCLRNRDPWLWVVYWLLEGRKQWTRPALLVYWALLGIISVAGWNRQLARSRRYRPRNAMGGMGEAQNGGGGTPASEPSRPPTPPSSASAMGLTFASVAMPQLPAFPHGANLGAALGASEWLDAADRRVPTLGLNGRRKFFHALAVVMFLPGVAADPAFAHLAFSAAFALFAFAEYVRYFALYPFGASVHLFMNEFLDHKDSGTAILSHFYLLTGCAGSVWFEGSSRLLLYTGTLAVGVGDAVASIVGKRVGRHRWSPTTSKTVEGSVAFTLSVAGFAWALGLCGLAEEFSVVRYTVIVGLSSVLEGLSGQNDNLTVPVYMWSMLVIGDV